MPPAPNLNIITLYLVKSIDTDSIIYVLVLIGMLATSALISGAEVAFFALKPQELDKINNQKSRKAKLIKNFLSRPKELLATILIANNFANVGVIILSTYISNAIFNFQGSELTQFLIQIVIITFLLLLFGEVLSLIHI